MHLILKFLAFLIFTSIYLITYAANVGNEKIFFSTKFNEVNIRNGPGKNHFIIGKFLKKGIPLLTLDQYENWHQVIDLDGKEGWVSSSQLQSKRYGIIIAEQSMLMSFPNKKSKKIAVLKRNVNFKINSCDLSWCNIQDKNLNGWIEKTHIWGVLSKEIL